MFIWTAKQCDLTWCQLLFVSVSVLSWAYEGRSRRPLLTTTLRRLRPNPNAKPGHRCPNISQGWNAGETFVPWSNETTAELQPNLQGWLRNSLLLGSLNGPIGQHLSASNGANEIGSPSEWSNLPFDHSPATLGPTATGSSGATSCSTESKLQLQLSYICIPKSIQTSIKWRNEANSNLNYLFCCQETTTN